MAKIGRLTALKVARTKAPGYYADGGGLYLQVTVNSRDGEPAKSWIYRYMLRGRAREMGLGSLSAISLQEARNRVGEYRRQRHDGIDPIEARKALREQANHRMTINCFVTQMPLEIWDKVAFACIEIWRIDKPPFDRDRFRAIIESFNHRSFGGALDIKVDAILDYASGVDWRHEDLYLWR